MNPYSNAKDEKNRIYGIAKKQVLHAHRFSVYTVIAALYVMAVITVNLLIGGSFGWYVATGEFDISGLGITSRAMDPSIGYTAYKWDSNEKKGMDQHNSIESGDGVNMNVYDVILHRRSSNESTSLILRGAVVPVEVGKDLHMSFALNNLDDYYDDSIPSIYQADQSSGNEDVNLLSSVTTFKVACLGDFGSIESDAASQSYPYTTTKYDYNESANRSYTYKDRNDYVYQEASRLFDNVSDSFSFVLLYNATAGSAIYTAGDSTITVTPVIEGNKGKASSFDIVISNIPETAVTDDFRFYLYIELDYDADLISDYSDNNNASFGRLGQQDVPFVDDVIIDLDFIE